MSDGINDNWRKFGENKRNIRQKKVIKDNTHKDIYRVKVDSLTIRGGMTPTGKISMILGMPSAHEKDMFVVLKMDGEEKLSAIADCISTLMPKTKSITT